MTATLHSLPIELGQSLGERCMDLYRTGRPPGDSTGWRCMDRLFTVAPKQWTLIIGIPGSGKSEFLDAMMVNLAEQSGWKFAVYSPENYPSEGHLAKLVEKHLRKPFGKGPTTRMTENELGKAMETLLGRFTFLAPRYPNPANLLNAAEAFAMPGSKKFGIVLDPWNSLDHAIGKQREDQYLSEQLTMVTSFVRDFECHVFIVAHPKQLMRDKEGKRPVPTPYDTSGGSMWFNKPDNILCVHRPDKENNTPEVEVHVQKIRYKHIGMIGMAKLEYDKVTGRYDEVRPYFETVQPNAYRDRDDVHF
jgi:twinkle protein